MKVERVETWSDSVALARPYTIASRTIHATRLFFVRISLDEGLTGLGSAATAEEVTGESEADCAAALEPDALTWLESTDLRDLVQNCRQLETRMAATPAARAAVEMALFDLLGHVLDRPVVELLGRFHRDLQTSITIGIKEDVREALAEAREHVQRGFRALKVKIGRDWEADVELLRRLRESVSEEITIRVDGNRGYNLEQAARLSSLAENLGLELIEQPTSVAEFTGLRSLAASQRRILAADESLLDESDALDLLTPSPLCGVVNIKLMKCGGLTPALRIGRLAELRGVDLMWGCMDESRIGIAAALHAAYACPNTRYLDLDGSFDLAKDPARGGFDLVQGRLCLLDRPGLGVELRQEPAR